MNRRRFDFGFWQVSKPFYRKLKFSEKVLEEFQCLPRFPGKLVLYSWTNFCILRDWAVLSNLIRLDLGLWMASKPFYRKLKYREKVLEEFQSLPHFPRKMVLYSSTNFCILKPWAIISKLIRFDLDFWQVLKPFYRKLKYKEKDLEEFKRLPRFRRKMVLHLSTNFPILRPWAIISNLKSFDLGFWQSSKPFDTKLKYREEVMEEFQRLPRFPRKIVLYSSTNFYILKPWDFISNLIRFDLGFRQASKTFYRNLKYKEKDLEEFQSLPRFSKKMVLYSSTNFRILNPSAIISNLIRFDFHFWQASKPFYRTRKYKEKDLEEFKLLPRFRTKIVLHLPNNFLIWRPWASISNLIRSDLGFWRASKPF